ncbi:hypothetical protein AAVH_14972 [Aphelenchoides avenae]|nr:hypothetical protein AAVH_14972 [Aphelenchus avenae]
MAHSEDDAQLVRQIGLDELLNMYKVGQALKRDGSYADLYGTELMPRQAKRSEGADLIVDEKALFEQYQRSKSAPYMRFGRR